MQVIFGLSQNKQMMMCRLIKLETCINNIWKRNFIFYYLNGVSVCIHEFNSIYGVFFGVSFCESKIEIEFTVENANCHFGENLKTISRYKY